MAVLHRNMEQLKQAADSTKVFVKLPQKWVNMYEQFIIKNATGCGQVEGALRSLTYIIPGTIYHHSERLFVAND